MCSKPPGAPFGAIFLRDAERSRVVEECTDILASEAVVEDRTTQLYRTYGAIIYARCRQMLDSAAAAEDATQETFVRVYRHLENAPDSRQVLAWIYRIATNYCLNEIRNRKNRRTHLEAVPELPYELGEEPLANKDFVRRLITQIPERIRTVAWLYYVDGMNQEDVAEVLGISRRTVVNRLNAFAVSSRKFIKRNAS